jgi:predicted protein tyrosine phosphatase
MKVLFICTSNKDRSPALERYFRENYPQHEYRSAGVNRYFCWKRGTHYLTVEDIGWADLFVFAEDCHHKVAVRDFWEEALAGKYIEILSLGEYSEGCLGEDYLVRAEELLEPHLK